MSAILSFCIIEGPETVEGFVQLQMQEIDDNIKSRRNKIFLLMEEVRRLRIQQRLKIAEHSDEGCEDNELPDIPSTIPFLSHTTPKTLRQLYMTSFCVAFGIIVFGGLVAPINSKEVTSSSHLTREIGSVHGDVEQGGDRLAREMRVQIVASFLTEEARLGRDREANADSAIVGGGAEIAVVR
ncbi:hypothetical protein ZIOFF_033386 [Zingiber officinale]|uniref:Uncharacterized protein n=1 Tax=Zingiber officinale TaxID=94328 RepID=A0A8J5GI83_ZINOF|nr:hypothetical protein ZIOFF_033386 [Zingiber officinale]